jgi:S-sulfo-L-cysteine synthase (3-phospho-L-serine-dependent)
MKAALVFIESNTTGTGMLMLDAAARLGFEPVLATSDESRYRLPSGCTTVKLDTSKHEELRAWATNGMKGRIAGILSSSEYYTHSAAWLAEELELRSFGADAIRNCRNKHLQRATLSAAGLACPQFSHVSTAEQLAAVAAGATLPVVLKPCFGSGSVGVKLCLSVAELLEHGGRLLAHTQNERGLSHPVELLVEQYVEGDEFSIEVLAGSVVGITKKHLGELPHFVERGHDFPASLPERQASALEQTALASVLALGLSTGPAHVEARWWNGQPIIIEVNPRLAGGYIPEIVRRATGRDLLDDVIRLATGAHVQPWARPHRVASIRFGLASAAGVVADVVGRREAAAVPGVCDVLVYKSVGDRVEGQGDFRDRFGHVIAVADTVADSARAAEVACARLELKLRSS